MPIRRPRSMPLGPVCSGVGSCGAAEMNPPHRMPRSLASASTLATVSSTSSVGGVDDDGVGRGLQRGVRPGAVLGVPAMQIQRHGGEIGCGVGSLRRPCGSAASTEQPACRRRPGPPDQRPPSRTTAAAWRELGCRHSADAGAARVRRRPRSGRSSGWHRERPRCRCPCPPPPFARNGPGTRCRSSR